MSPKELTSIAIKFFSIYLLVNIILYFPSMIMSLTALQKFHEETFSTSVFIIIVGAFILLGLAVSFVLFKISNSIAKQAPTAPDSSVKMSQAFLLQTLGVFFIVSALSALPNFSSTLFFKSGQIDTIKIFTGSGYLFEALVGLYLLIKPSVWVNVLNKLRGRA